MHSVFRQKIANSNTQLLAVCNWNGLQNHAVPVVVRLWENRVMYWIHKTKNWKHWLCHLCDSSEFSFNLAFVKDGRCKIGKVSNMQLFLLIFEPCPLRVFSMCILSIRTFFLANLIYWDFFPCELYQLGFFSLQIQSNLAWLHIRRFE